jgi:ABC-2 type transport system permease protein
MRHFLAFARRDGQESRSYLASWLVEGSGILLTVFTFYFLGKWVDEHSGATLPGGTRSYFGFAVNGIAMALLLFQVVRGHSRALRHAQITGTLEPLLMTPVPPWQLALGGALSHTGRGVARLVAYLALALALGAVRVEPALVWLPVVILAATLSFLPLGLLAATATVLLKRGDPVAYLANAASLLLGGVYFPASVLPAWLRPASELYPATQAIRALRAVTLGAGDVGAPVLWLLTFALVTLPPTAWLFERAVDRARSQGTLGQM